MKKVYLLVSGLLLTAGAVNAQMTDMQQRAAVNFAPFVKDNVANRAGLTEDREADDIVWEDDFSDASNWVADGPAADYDLNGWSIGSTTWGWYFGDGDDMGTTGDFARFVNGDPRATPDPDLGLPVEDGPFTITYDGSIDLDGVPAPHIEFDQYGARFLTLHAVQVRTGTEEWVTVGTNDDIPPVTIDGGSAFGQPETKRYNITGAIAGGDLTDVQVRFLWDGAMNGADMNYVEYAWFVDNVRIVEGHAFDSDIQASYFRAGLDVSFVGGLEYYKFPLEQASETEIFFSAETINQGGSTYTGLYLDARVEKDADEVYAGTSDADDVEPAELDSTGTTTSFVPTELGTHEVSWIFVGDDADTYNDNDMMTDEFEVTSDIYSRAIDNLTNAITNFASNGGNPFSIGNGMDIFADGVIGAIDVRINDAATNVGESIYGQINIFSEDDGDFIYLGQTADHSITSGENGGTIRLVFEEAIEVSAGDLVLVMAGHYGGNDVGFGMAQSVTEGVWGYDAASTRFGLLDPEAIMVSAVMTSFESVGEETASNFAVSQNIPNPFGENSVINYELNEAANVSVEFVDIPGKVVKTINNGTQTAGAYTLDVNGNDFAEGVYFYTFTVGAEKITKRMIITK